MTRFDGVQEILGITYHTSTQIGDALSPRNRLPGLRSDPDWSAELLHPHP